MDYAAVSEQNVNESKIEFDTVNHHYKWWHIL